jgi:hypothetical protein
MDEKVYDIDALGNYGQGYFLEPMPGNPKEASTFDNNKQVYGYDALGNLVQEGFLEPIPPEACTFSMEEQVYGYDGQGDFLEPMPGNPEEASTFSNNKQFMVMMR